MSVLDNMGRLTWTTREAVILACPYKPELKLGNNISQCQTQNLMGPMGLAATLLQDCVMTNHSQEI